MIPAILDLEEYSTGQTQERRLMTWEEKKQWEVDTIHIFRQLLITCEKRGILLESVSALLSVAMRQHALSKAEK